MTKQPKYQPGQLVKIQHSWALNLPPQRIVNSVWDQSWGCFTYALVGAGLRIEEHELKEIENE